MSVAEPTKTTSAIVASARWRLWSTVVAVVVAVSLVAACQPATTTTDRIGAGSLALVPEVPDLLAGRVTVYALPEEVGTELTVSWRCGTTEHAAATLELEDLGAGAPWSGAAFPIPAEVTAIGVMQVRSSCVIRLTRPIAMGAPVNRSLAFNAPHDWGVIFTY